MTPELYSQIQKAMYYGGELIASRRTIEVIADIAIAAEQERCAEIAEAFAISQGEVFGHGITIAKRIRGDD